MVERRPRPHAAEPGGTEGTTNGGLRRRFRRTRIEGRACGRRLHDGDHAVAARLGLHRGGGEGGGRLRLGARSGMIPLKHGCGCSDIKT